jgi:hypothetical protein
MGKQFFINLIKALAPILLRAIDRFIRKRVEKEKEKEPDTRQPSFDEAQGTPIVDYHKNDNA